MTIYMKTPNTTQFSKQKLHKKLITTQFSKQKLLNDIDTI